MLYMKLRFAQLAGVSLLFICMGGIHAGAHSLGVSLEVESGNFFIDIGYDPSILEEGYATRFEFELYTKEKEPVRFDHVWVRVEDEISTVLAAGIAQQEFGPTTLLYTFPESGNYVLDVSYRAGEEEIARASFPLFVEEKSQGFFAKWGILAASAVAGALIGIACILFFRKYRS
jgi:hypothetical protein